MEDSWPEVSCGLFHHEAHVVVREAAGYPSDFEWRAVVVNLKILCTSQDLITQTFQQTEKMEKKTLNRSVTSTPLFIQS